MTELTDEMKAFLKALEGPMLEMAQAAITKVVPPQFAGPVTLVLDAVDGMVHAANPNVPAVLAQSGIPTESAVDASLDARVTALEQHVAALTMATGNDTSTVMATLKQQVKATAPAAAVAVPAKAA